MEKRIQDALSARKDGDKGFTLIELLVVVLIIGILAAIAIPVYIGQQKSAQDAAAQSDVANAKLAIVAYQAANPSASLPAAAGIGTTLSTYGWPHGSSIYLGGTDFTDFTVCEKSASGTKYYHSGATADTTNDAIACTGTLAS